MMRMMTSGKSSGLFAACEVMENRTMLSAAPTMATAAAVADANIEVAFNAPTDIALSGTTVIENKAIGTLVGTLSATDPDSAGPFSFSLVSGDGAEDNASFSITGAQLRTTSVFQYAQKNNYSIRVRVTDATGLSFEKAFAIDVVALSLTVVGTAAADNIAVSSLGGSKLAITVNGTRNNVFALSLVISGGDGDDSIIFDSNVSAASSISGGNGSDTITTGAGNDTISGNASADVIRGGAGNDSITGGAGVDSINGNGGLDSLFGGDGQDTLRGGGGNDSIDGRDKDDSLFGGVGDDTLLGGNGNDSITAGDGNDFIDVDDRMTPLFRDTVNGGLGFDTVDRDLRDVLTDVEVRL